MLYSSLLLIALSSSTQAKLWGWPEDDFSIHKQELQANFKPQSLGSESVFCPGWGKWCKGDKGNDPSCETLNKFVYSGRMPVGNFYIEKPNSAQIDLWRIEGTETYNIFERGEDGTIHGQCQLHKSFREACQYTGFTELWIRPMLHCWQW